MRFLGKIREGRGKIRMGMRHKNKTWWKESFLGKFCLVLHKALHFLFGVVSSGLKSEKE